MQANSSSRWDWLAAVLLVCAVFTAAVRLDTTSWTPDLSYVEPMAVLGTLLGLALGVSQFQRTALRWLVSGYTLVIIPMHLSKIIVDEKTVLGQLASLGGRLAASLGFLFNAKAIEDPVFFVVLMSVLFWSIGIYSGYRLSRSPAILPVLLPSTLPVLIIQYYDGYKIERIWGLAFYFFLALMLAGRMNLLRARERWEKQNVMAGSDPEFDLNRNIAIAAAVIILIAWTLPAPAAVLPAAAHMWKNLSEIFDTPRQRINDALAALNGGSKASTASELYGSVMGLGRVAGSGEAELFNVHAPSNNLPRLYWRVRTYDVYQSGSWQTTNSQTTPFLPDQGNLVREDILPAPSDIFVFNWQSNQSALLVTPALPIWTSRTGSIQIAQVDGMDTDLLSWNAKSNLQTGDQYQVRALLLSPTRKDLQAAAGEYPLWVKERYLQVPENIAPDMSRLAAQITAGESTDFDKVEAVTEYLRKNITYSETIQDPPPGMDPVTWFLFGWKKGFCNYYASAEVLLLRSVGIPARMVVGYAQGKSGNYGTYSVRGLDAHAWPEVYFPGIGWVEFEPTANQNALVRPSGEQIAGGNNNQRPDLIDGLENEPRGGREAEDPILPETTREATFWGLTRARWQWVIISIVGLVAAGGLAWRFERRQSFAHRVPRAVRAMYTFYKLKSPPWVERWVRWSEVSGVERAFHAINQSLDWLGRPQPDYATPAERAQLLKKIVPDASEDIDTLTSALEQTIYTAHPAASTSAVRLGWKIRFWTVRKMILRRFNGE